MVNNTGTQALPVPTPFPSAPAPRPRPALPVLFVDDEPDNLKLFRLHFDRAFPVLTAASAQEALRLLEKEDVGVVATDERMPGMSGTDLLAEVVQRWPDVGRIIISAYSDSGRVLAAINRGQAQEYVLKPWERGDLLGCLERGLTTARRRRELAAKSELADAYASDLGGGARGAERLVGLGAGLKSTCHVARRAAQTSATVLIRGETGTGKELVARFIHDESARAGGPFVGLNCAALPEGLLESELFGHEQGAFTGAARARKGRFELAQGGTLFLDEIGDVSPRLQLSLLRVLQERRLERLGSAQPIALDVRVVAATHRDLEKLVADGTFRHDLYYRLNVIQVQVPPLRERREDIPALMQHFIEKWGAKGGIVGRVPRLGADVLPLLMAYQWPGNVRELENLVQRALALAEGPELTIDDFSLSFPRREAVPAGTVREEVSAVEAERLRQVLIAHGGNCARAARALDIPRTTLVSRAKKLGLI